MKVFDKSENKEPVAILSRWAKQKTGRCWAPQMDCKDVPIRAHSVQNARVLESIQVDGHVIGIEVFLKNGELHVGFRKVGRNKATTFLGLCNSHDTEIFSHLDLNELDLNDEKTCLLLTWRSITHEMAAKMEQGVKFQSEYQSKIDAGETDGNTPHPMGMEAVLWMKVLYDFFQYREENVSPAIFSEQRHPLIFKKFVISGTGAILATSSFFVEQGQPNREPSYVSVNAFPMDGNTVVLFSVARKDLGVVMPVIRSLIVKRKLCPIRFSAFLLSRVQNFVISPHHFSQWSQEKVDAIEKAFASTVVNTNWVDANELHNLF